MRCCVKCRYDLAGAAGDICPECGHNQNISPPFWRDGRVHFGWIVLLSLLPAAILGGLSLFLLSPNRHVPRELWPVYEFLFFPPGPCFLYPLLLLILGVSTIKLAGSRSAVHRPRRRLICFFLLLGADVMALLAFYKLAIKIVTSA